MLKTFPLCTLISFQKIISPSLKTNAFPEVSLLKEIKVLMCDVIFRILQYFYDDGESQPYNDITGVLLMKSAMLESKCRLDRIN